MTLGQSPGAIGTTNLTSWFKPDNLTVGNVVNWTTAFPTGASAITLSESGAPFPIATKTPPNATSNYNMTIDFSGNSSSNLRALENPAALNLLDNNNSTDEGSFFASYYLPANSSCGGCHVVNYIESGSLPRDGIQFRAKLGTSTGRLAIGSGNSTNASRDYTQDFERDIISYTGNKSGVGTMTAYKKSEIFTGGGASATTGFQGLYFGARRATTTFYNAPFDGYINEIITFNKSLTPLEASKVHTYLSIKYGSTLSNSGGGAQGDYIATDGTVVWDASFAGNYHNNVIGLCREDDEALLQKQSHAFDDTIRIYLNTLATSNDLNSASAASFGNDISYIILGDNQGSMCATPSSSLELPPSCPLYSRLEREWKITKTQFSSSVNLDFKLNGCAIPGSVSSSDLYLLVDDDGNFANGGTTCFTNGDGSGIVINFNGSIITASNLNNIHVPNNTTQFLTIASALPTTPLPIELGSFDVVCSGTQNIIEWRTITEHNNDYFTLEKSIDGINFEELAIIKGAGNSTTESIYNWTDLSRNSELTYYRLTQTDFNGESSVSSTITSTCKSNEDLLFYPNPFNSILRLDSYYSGQMEILDVTGAIIKSETINKGLNSYYLDDIESGHYFMKTTLTNGTVEITKIIKTDTH